MQLRLSDPSYTDRLVTFLRSLRQTVFVADPGQLEIVQTSGAELAIYLRVWDVLYPDADVQVEDDDGDEDAA
jgi:hypothetical protein